MTANLDPHLAALEANPNDESAFEQLEQAYLASADWDALTGIYRKRLADPNLQDPRKRSPLHFRLGQILEERCLEIELAVEQYTEAVQVDPNFRPALRQLRQVHAGREAWDMVLQIAEIELGTLREPYERAEFFADMGRVWLDHVHQPTEAMSCFEQALAIDANEKSALEGVARTLEAQGQPEAAAAAWEQLIGCVRGPDRAGPLVALATLLSGPLHQEERAVELYKRALSDDPRNEVAVEALSISAASKGQWELLSDLYERRFSLAAGAKRRTAIALEAGYMNLEQIGNSDAARIWFERAQEFATDEASVMAAFADLARTVGDEEAQVEALERAASAGGLETPLRLLLEAAALLTDRADDEQALELLELAQQKRPDSAPVLEGLSVSYANLLRYEDLISVLERRASLAEGDAERCAGILVEAGHIHATHLNDDEAAQDALERAYAAHPATAGLASKLEAVYRKTESWDALRALLEQARENGPVAERAGFHCSLGELLEEQFHELDAAAVSFEASLDLDPNPRALQGLSRLAQTSGDPEAMISALEREAAMTSDTTRLGEVCDELRQRYEDRNEFEIAVDWADRAASTNETSVDFLERVASLLERLERHDDLGRTLTRLEEIQSGPDLVGVQRRLAQLSEAQDDDEAAIGYWEAALSGDPNDVASLSALRRHYAERGRADDLAPVLRKLADLVPRDECAGVLDELSILLEEQLVDLDGAIVVLWRLQNTPGRPETVGGRLEALLERAGRFEELVQQLLESRRGLPEDGAEAIRIELRRGQLLLDPLGQFEEAVKTFRGVRRHAPDNEDATAGLERALRAANDSSGLARLLAEIADQTDDKDHREQIRFERAVLLEESLGELEQARQAYAALSEADSSPGMATQAALRLERLLERCGDWSSLLERLEASIAAASPDEKLALHERAASLCGDRMGDPEGCAEHLEAAAELDPGRPDPWRNLSRLYKQLDRPGDLLRVTEAELETAPDPERERVLRARAATISVQQSADPENASLHYERLLELEPGRSDATEFLVEHYRQENRYDEIVALLEARLEAVAGSEETTGTDPNQGLQTSLRIRIAELRVDRLDDPDGAIAALEPAYLASGPSGPATEPLAELYQSTRRHGDLIELCERASQACSDPAERAIWLLKLADCLRDEDEDAGAAAAYREVLDERPDDDRAYTALGHLYRKGDKFEPLAELLDSWLPRVSGAEAIGVRMELAQLLEDELNRPAEALTHLQRVIETESNHDAAFHHAMRLAERQGSHGQLLELLDSRLELRMPPEERAELLEQRATLQSGPLKAPEAAVSTLREVIALDPNRASARRAIREALETLGRWTAVLDCLYVDAEGAGPDERMAIYERAVEIATTHVGPDAALPWLERLRSVRPDDVLVIARIADVHRHAGRFESVLRALEDELALTAEVDRKREIHVGRARILERDMTSPGRAVAAYEAARSLAPEDASVLQKLDELYGVTGRPKDRVDVIERRIGLLGDAPQGEAGDRLQLHLAAAALYSESLVDPTRAIPHLLHAVFLTRSAAGGVDKGPVSTPEERIGLLSNLAATLLAAGREEACARALEAELSVLLLDLAEHPASSEDADPRLARRAALHLDLSTLYVDTLANRTSGLHHMRTLADLRAAGACEQVPQEHLDRIERTLLDQLRQDANWIELTDRLAVRLERGPGTAEEWLELSRLLDEQLHAPKNALDAYAQALSHDPSSLTAIRGLRGVAERLADWPQVVRSLDIELALPQGWSPHERAACSRRIGDISWHKLDALDRAARAYEAALEADPRDLQALRALEELSQRQGEWTTALDLFARESEVLGDDDDERLEQVWLTSARIAAKNVQDPSRATRAYENAAAVSPLAPEDQLALAMLYEQTGELEKYADTYTAWCENPTANVTADEQLALVETLVSLGRRDDALECARKATRIDAHNTTAWATLAERLQDRGDDAEAADAWERAGELRHGPPAADHLTSAALLVEATDLEAAARRLRRAASMDAGAACAHAHLARVAFALESFAESETAATRGLDLAAAGSGAPMAGDLQLETALVGGRAAREQDRLESAMLFFGVSLDLCDDHEEALEAYGELLFERGDLAAARGALEARLEGGADPRRAERLTMLGSVLELAGETVQALTRFRQAVTCDRTWGAGHAGVARLSEKAGHIDEAVEALAGWASSAQAGGDTESCAARLLRAAELELARDRIEAAEAHLVRALQVAPDTPRAWVLLAEILSDAERPDDLLEMGPQALLQEGVRQASDAVARISLLIARAFEQREQLEEACDAYAEAARNDPRDAESALAAARLLRTRGDWQAAADMLREFCDGHPDPDHRDLAEAHYKLARLLAGPLEDIEGAITQFERVLEVAPDHAKAREPLATLLSVIPDRWNEAIVHHRALLDEEPTRSGSLRALHQIAKGRGQSDLAPFGLSILRSIGTASPSEREEAPELLSRRVVSTPELEDAKGEAARRVIQNAADVLDEVLETSPDTADASADFAARLRAAEREIFAAGLDRFSDEQIGDLVCTIAALSLGDEADTHVPETRLDPALVQQLDRALGRWARRKVRRGLEETSLADLQAIDFAAWRLSVRGLAAAVAVDASEGDLRAALLATCQADVEAGPENESEDWTTRIQGEPLANELLRRVNTGWCTELSRG